jgi:transcriptional regulator with XRE-family HTH domain
MDISERYAQQRRDLGARLRALRETASLTGTQAAERTGMSQPKISKIETAVLLPSVEDVETLLRLYGARTRDRDELLELASSLHATYESARTVVRRGAARAQRQIGEIEADTHLRRVFELAWVSPLLQTPEYMRQVLETGSRRDELARIIAAREERQLALYDGEKRFHFILTESALRVRPGQSTMLQVQLERVSALSKLPNVRVGVIPSSTDLTEIPLHGFDIYDERLVTVVLETSTVTFTELREVAQYLTLFSGLEKKALFGDEGREYIADIGWSLSESR